MFVFYGRLGDFVDGFCFDQVVYVLFWFQHIDRCFILRTRLPFYPSRRISSSVAVPELMITLDWFSITPSLPILQVPRAFYLYLVFTHADQNILHMPILGITHANLVSFVRAGVPRLQQDTRASSLTFSHGRVSVPANKRATRTNAYAR